MNTTEIGFVFLMMLISLPAVAQSQLYVRGTVPPGALILVGPHSALVQSFVADGQKFSELQLLVALSKTKKARPLSVEVRTPDLTIRLGHGEIRPGNSSRKPRWRTVRWREQPRLEKDAKYVLVLTVSGTPNNLWSVATSRHDVYPWGELRYTRRVLPSQTTDAPKETRRVLISKQSDIGFRAKFRNGAAVQSLLWATAAQERDPVVISNTNLRRSWTSHRALPLCHGNLCADPTRYLVGDVESRRVRATQHFETCGYNDNHLGMTTPTSGLSCRDVCNAFEFGECEGNLTNPFLQCSKDSAPTNIEVPGNSCDYVLFREEAICACEPAGPKDALSTDPPQNPQ